MKEDYTIPQRPLQTEIPRPKIASYRFCFGTISYDRESQRGWCLPADGANKFSRCGMTQSTRLIQLNIKTSYHIGANEKTRKYQRFQIGQERKKKTLKVNGRSKKLGGSARTAY